MATQLVLVSRADWHTSFPVGAERASLVAGSLNESEADYGEVSQDDKWRVISSRFGPESLDATMENFRRIADAAKACEEFN